MSRSEWRKLLFHLDYSAEKGHVVNGRNFFQCLTRTTMAKARERKKANDINKRRKKKILIKEAINQECGNPRPVTNMTAPGKS